MIPRHRFEAQKRRWMTKYKNVPLEDFAGGQDSGTFRYSYPCNTPGRCIAALAYARHAPRPDIIRKHVYMIAKRKGFIDPRTGKIRRY